MQRVARAVSKALHGLDLVAVRLDGEHEAGADRLAVQQDGAGAAHPVLTSDVRSGEAQLVAQEVGEEQPRAGPQDRKSTRLNSSHTVISYAVFCLKKKKKRKT